MLSPVLATLLRVAGPLPVAPFMPLMILGGEEVAASTWANVVAISVPDPDTPWLRGVCTGAYLGQGVVLTAAHCLTGVRDIGDITVYFGDTIDAAGPGRIAGAADFGVHPDATIHRSDINRLDFGYVLLEQTVDGVPPIPPIVDQAEWDAAMRVGADVVLVGFGATGSDGEGSGRKRQVATTIRDISSAGDRFEAGGDGENGCRGDSGGPAFIALASGAWRLAGVLSDGHQPCERGGSFFGVPYPVLAWLRAETGLDLLPVDCPAGDCLDLAQPDPPACACDDTDSREFILLAPLLALRRRRSA